MTRYKGASSKGALTIEDLNEILDCYHRIQRIQGSLNMASNQKLPLLAASATLKACWAELSGAQAATGWSFPPWAMTQMDPNKVVPEPQPMKRFGIDPD